MFFLKTLSCLLLVFWKLLYQGRQWVRHSLVSWENSSRLFGKETVFGLRTIKVLRDSRKNNFTSCTKSVWLKLFAITVTQSKNCSDLFNKLQSLGIEGNFVTYIQVLTYRSGICLEKHGKRNKSFTRVHKSHLLTSIRKTYS